MYFKLADIFVLDRGFERVRNELTEKGFKVLIPAFLKKVAKQLETRNANVSRLCMKQRWAVESVNSSIKQFKYLRQTIPS